MLHSDQIMTTPARQKNFNYCFSGSKRAKILRDSEKPHTMISTQPLGSIEYSMM